MSEQKIVVCVSGNGSNLQAIIDQIHRTNIATLACVISNRPKAHAITRATAAHIPTRVIDHTQYETREQFEQALIQVIDPIAPQYIVLAGFMRILSPLFIQHYAHRIINIHPSLLPKYKGLNTHERVLASNDTEHGSSIHLVTADLDNGPVISQSIVPILPGDTKEELTQRVLLAEHKLYPSTLIQLLRSNIRITEQGTIRRKNSK